MQIGGTEKMSKSKNNGVDPQAMVDKYGADTVRLFSMFAAPPEQSLEWNEAGVEGMSRFLRRLWAQAQKHARRRVRMPVAVPDAASLSAEQKTTAPQDPRDHRQGRRRLRPPPQLQHRHCRGDGIARTRWASSTMPATRAAPSARKRCEATVLLLNPITPHISHALWQVLGHAETLLEDLPFPQADPAALVRDAVTLAVQVNGKLRGTIEVAADLPRDQVEALALGRAQYREVPGWHGGPQGDRRAGQDRQHRCCLIMEGLVPRMFTCHPGSLLPPVPGSSRLRP